MEYKIKLRTNDMPDNMYEILNFWSDSKLYLTDFLLGEYPVDKFTWEYIII